MPMIEFHLVNDDDGIVVPHRYLDFGAATGNIDLISLSNGGFASLGDGPGGMVGHVFNSKANSVTTFSADGKDGSLDQLRNNNLLVAGEDKASGGIVYKVVNSLTGADVVPEITTHFLTNAVLSNPDVAAFTSGGFAIAAQANFGGTDNDIELEVHDAQGDFIAAYAMDVTEANDTDVSLTQIRGGRIAVAWTRAIGSETEIWYSVRAANGSQIKGPTLLDTDGTINGDASICALKGGGFAIAYQDNEYSGDGTRLAITLAALDGSGNNVVRTDVAATEDGGIVSGLEANPHLVTLSNGLLALSANSSNQDSFVSLIDPATGHVIENGSRDIITTNIEHNSETPIVAAFGSGYLITGDNDLTDGDARGEVVAIQRTVDLFFGSSDVFHDQDGFLDNITGFVHDETIDGGAGNDTIDGGGGNDRVIGGDGNDLLQGGGAVDTIYGGNGSDRIYAQTVASPGSAIDFFMGDLLSGEAGSDFIRGAGEADKLLGGSGNDTLDGGDIDDEFGFDDNNDTMNGGAGNDVYIVTDAGDKIVETPNGGIDTIQSSVSLALGSGLENLRLIQNAVNGTGTGLANVLTGNRVANQLLGGLGNDTLNGGLGRDSLTGGGGVDQFDYNKANESGAHAAGRDHIIDFAVNADRIDLSTIDAIPGGANNAFAFRGTLAFTAAGQVRVVQSGADTIVEVNTAGTSGAEMTILLAGVTATKIDALDFVL